MAAPPVSAVSGLNSVLWSIAVIIQLILSFQATYFLLSDAFLCAGALRKHFRPSSEPSAAKQVQGPLCSMSSRPLSTPPEFTDLGSNHKRVIPRQMSKTIAFIHPCKKAE
jgi:hypothetical protein